MSSWHNRQRRRANARKQQVVLKYVFTDGKVIDDYGDGEGQKKAAQRILTAPTGSKLAYRAYKIHRAA